MRGYLSLYVYKYTALTKQTLQTQRFSKLSNEKNRNKRKHLWPKLRCILSCFWTVSFVTHATQFSPPRKPRIWKNQKVEVLRCMQSVSTRNTMWNCPGTVFKCWNETNIFGRLNQHKAGVAFVTFRLLGQSFMFARCCRLAFRFFCHLLQAFS